MGIKSTTKILKSVAGVHTEFATLTTSTGASDSHAIPALGSEGVLDPSIINGTTTSSGVSDALKVVQLDAAGRLDSSTMPIGFGDDAGTFIASETLSAGDFVHIWDNGGAFNVRLADAGVVGKEAQGFILDNAASGANVKVYFEGTNTAVTGQSAGVVYLSTNAGIGSATPPSNAGNVVQRIGFATSASSMNFQHQPITVLA